MYRVIKYFTDLEDNRYAYHVGDPFPHEGMEVSKERLAELSSDKNKRGVPLIEEVETEETKEEAEPVENTREATEAKPVDETEPVETEEKAVKKSRKRTKKG